MKFKIQTTWAIVIVFLMGIFYYGLVNTNQKEDFFEMRKTLPVVSNILRVEFNLPSRDEYLLRVKHLIEKEQAKTVLLNGGFLELKFSKKGSDTLTEYYRISVDTIRKGSNFLKVNFYSGSPPEVEIWVGNYISRELEGNIFFLLRKSLLVGNRPGLILYSVVFVIVLFLIWQGSLYFWQRFFAISAGKATLHNMISFSPSFSVMGLAWTVSNFSPKHLPVSLLISSSYLYKLVIFSVVLAQVIIGVLIVLIISWRRLAYEKGSKPLEEEKETSPLLSERTEAVILEEILPGWIIKAVDWVKRRDFSDKCVLLFIMLLILCAFFLILGLEWIAEQLANIAYFSLVIGVGIKFVYLIRGKGCKKD